MSTYLRIIIRMVVIAVAGATGYVGGEILRLLVSHPLFINGTLEIGALTGSTQVGKAISQVHSHIPQLYQRVVVDTSTENLSQADYVFFALPHGQSATVAASLADSIKKIDCGADFRLPDEQLWHRYYSGDYAGSWTYGLPEIPQQREKIRASTQVAIPGCYPTAAILGLYPLVDAQWCENAITITGVSGTSGAGKSSQPEMTSAEIIGSIRAYNPGGAHRHLAELTYYLRQAYRHDISVTFTPVIVPASRGILAISTAQTSYSLARIHELYTHFYADEPCVVVLPLGDYPQTSSVLGANTAHIGIAKDENTGVVTIISAIDNLTKGTAGAAIQCWNMMMGHQEMLGLSLAGLAP